MLCRLAVAGVLCFSGAVSREIDEDSFVEEAEDEDVEEEVEDADEDAALDGDEGEDDEQVDDEDADDEEDEDEEEEEEEVDDADEVAEEGGEEEPEQEENAEAGNGDDPSSLEESNEDEKEVAPNPKYKAKSKACNKAGKKIALGKTDGGQWRCMEGFCIPLQGRCNGLPNCIDKSDEVGCADAQKMSTPCNPAGMKIPIGQDDGKQFRCAAKYCIPLTAKCNGFANCYDGSDEKKC